MSRVKMVAGNWKMNLNFQDGMKLAKAIRSTAQASSNKLVVMAPPFLHLKSVSDVLVDHKYIRSAAQNCHVEDSGAYTGDVSAEMIKSIGVEYVIIGHSERRANYNETDELLKQKVDKVLEKELLPIFCCGEPLEIRKGGTHEAHVASQISNSLFHLSAEAFAKIVVAYEPIWAIGTGETASPQQAQDMHASLRKLIAGKYGEEVADGITILYGGSVKPGNAKELFGQPDVDGGLVGGASLNADGFCEIISAM